MQYKIFGCKTNKYFTDRWAESSILAGKSGVFVSSCVVTDKAKTKWVRFVKQQLKTLKADEKIYISGCGSIRDGAVDADFYMVYPEFEAYRDRIELLPEDPESPHPNPLPEGEGTFPPSPFGRRAGDEGSRGLG